MSRTFLARYPGRCANCDEGIEVDDLLTYADDVVIHADCNEAPRPDRKPTEVCPRCFIAKALSGECGCD